MPSDPTTPIEIVAQLALALRDVIQTTPDESLSSDPEEIYMDLACRLIVRLAPRIAVVPKADVGVPPSLFEGYRQMRAVSADLVRVLATYRREGYELDVLVLAATDALVKLKRIDRPRAMTAELLTELATEILDTAQGEAESGEDVH